MDYNTKRANVKKIYSDFQQQIYQPTSVEFWELYMYRFIDAHQLATYDAKFRDRYEAYLKEFGKTLDFGTADDAENFFYEIDKKLNARLIKQKRKEIENKNGLT